MTREGTRPATVSVSDASTRSRPAGRFGGRNGPASAPEEPGQRQARGGKEARADHPRECTGSGGVLTIDAGRISREVLSPSIVKTPPDPGGYLFICCCARSVDGGTIPFSRI